jgi:hypothetical protein
VIDWLHISATYPWRKNLPEIILEDAADMHVVPKGKRRQNNKMK